MTTKTTPTIQVGTCSKNFKLDTNFLTLSFWWLVFSILLNSFGNFRLTIFSLDSVTEVIDSDLNHCAACIGDFSIIDLILIFL